MLKSVGEIFQRRELVLELTKRQLTSSHKGSVLGIFWMLLSPLLLLILYVIVFGFIFGGKLHSSGDESRFEYGITIFLGLTVIHFVTEILATAPRSMFAHANFLQRTTIPMQIIPVSTFLTAVFHLLTSGTLVLVGFLFLNKDLSIHFLWMFPVVACLLTLGLGLSWLMASLGTLFKDISELVPVLSMAVLFGSAVFYPIDQIPPAIWKFLRFNPILHVVNELRSTILWHNNINFGSLAYMAVFSLGCLLLGWLVFHSTKRKLAELV